MVELGVLMSNDDEYIEEIRVVRRKKDTHRSKSSKSKDFESDLLHSNTSKNVAGPTESRRVNEQELRERYQSAPIFVTPAASSPRELTPSQQALADVIADAESIVIREFLVPLIRDVAAPARPRRSWASSRRVSGSELWTDLRPKQNHLSRALRRSTLWTRKVSLPSPIWKLRSLRSRSPGAPSCSPSCS